MTQEHNNLFVFEAIGTRWWIENLDQRPIPAVVQDNILEYVQQFDERYSRFKQKSFVSLLQRGERISDPPSEFIDILRFARDLYHASDGQFNVSIGGKLHAQGYGKRADAAPTYSNPWKYIHFEKREVYLDEEMMIDIGGFGKGWLIDKISSLLSGSNINQYIVNGGGYMYVCSNLPISIAIEDPHDSEKMYGKRQISNQALAVSSHDKRFWYDQATKRSHIQSIEDKSQITDPPKGVIVTAQNATLADAIATVLMLDPGLATNLHQKYNFQSEVFS